MRVVAAAVTVTVSAAAVTATVVTTTSRRRNWVEEWKYLGRSGCRFQEQRDALSTPRNAINCIASNAAQFRS